MLVVQKRIVAMLIASISITSAFAEIDPDAQQVDAWLQKFQENPKQQMNQLPMKQGAKTTSKFPAQQVRQRDFVTQKAAQRKKQFPTAPAGGRAGIEANDQARQLVDNSANMLTKLSAMDAKLKKGKLKVQPWSDTYWPLYQGTLGNRYADGEFPGEFKDAMDYALKKNFAGEMRMTPAAIEDLSPAEKYDLLIGNKNFEFTRANWNEGKYYWDTQKKVETWMGICHGWAPAAFMLPRPEKKIIVTAADGKTKIPFYPSDVKSLGSLLYAKSNVPTKFIGGRCNDKDPKEDPNGRILSQDCFDNNPGAFHMAVVNQIGVSKRSMVLDATYDYEVWNQPIESYSYTYFNPKTNKTVSKLSAAKVDLRDLTKDKFKKYRSPKAKSVVGIAMNLTYIVETNPSHNAKDSADMDATTTATYMYDLELDEAGNIIGGEWYQNTHPDFLWTPTKDADATLLAGSEVDGKWSIKKALPADWAKSADALAEQQTPLVNIVDVLFKAAASAEE